MNNNLHTLDKLRGHSLVPPEDLLLTIPRLYETDTVALENKTAYVHYFVGGCDWYLFELDPKNWLAFGWADLNDPANAEMGYFSVAELATIKVRHPSGLLLYVERDLPWRPKAFGEHRASEA